MVTKCNRLQNSFDFRNFYYKYKKRNQTLKNQLFQADKKGFFKLLKINNILKNRKREEGIFNCFQMITKIFFLIRLDCFFVIIINYSKKIELIRNRQTGQDQFLLIKYIQNSYTQHFRHQFSYHFYLITFTKSIILINSFTTLNPQHLSSYYPTTLSKHNLQQFFIFQSIFIQIHQNKQHLPVTLSHYIQQFYISFNF
ncbi:unnamed protein product [Paramecium octaurelia]|uniref:Uncharacterized protein n=1 Tax=Paramecium octaurelia TaxID=43137 RepID=A0A8S1UD58_PAROT|nr:unnamed protein product [Paramecium octaurelia]